MAKVDVIKAQVSVTDRRRRSKSIERKRVAAYCRVSTDSEDQLNSYRSQVQYYTDKISENVDWMMAGIYADEAITGTQVAKREGFQKMINDCMCGQIDMIITKSISRFARNTLDTLKYVRMLKEKDIAVFFEDENINTLSMDGELLLVVLSSVAQQEVENISSNVKKGLAMKMSCGEIVGFAGALGYDYDPETKTISVNEEEAKVVRYIFKRYIEGMGAHVIARELEQMGALTYRGNKSWYDSTVLGIIKNEKYKGDLLQGKTFTVDPITKRRLGNLREVDQYLMKDHHEPIISEEMWEQAQAILKRRTVVHENSNVDPNSYREQYSRKFAFSCMVKCGFCGASLTRRSWHSGSKYHKNIWLCISSSKYGKKNCPESKGIAEEVLESAFVESYRMITNDHKDVLEEFLQRTEEELHSDATLQEIERVKKELKQLDQKMQRLLDMHLEQQIDFGTYEDKKLEIIKEQQLKTTELKRLQGEADVEKDLRKRLDAMRKLLFEAPILKEFDRNVFESIVEKVIVGGYDDEGNADPWVEEKYRRQGIGSALIHEAERTAREKGCHLMTLGTFDFQAKPLYEKYGFTVCGIIKDCPTKGHTHYDMIKRLDDPSDESVVAAPCAFEIQSGDEDDAEYIDDKLLEYNWSQVPAVHDFEWIGRKIQGDNGEPAAAGFADVNFWNIAFVEVLWVDEPQRNQGIGSYLLSEIEREAKKNGACIVMIDACDWNVNFFKKHGYTVYCTLEDYPNGYSKDKLLKLL